MQIKGNDKEVKALRFLQSISDSGKALRVAMIDGGVDVGHSNFSNANIECHETSCTNPTQHGTAVADLILQIAPKSTLIPVTTFNEQRNGNLKGCSERELAKGINKAIERDCDVINISGAALSSQGLGDSDLRQSVDQCHKNGILVIAAVGNEGLASESVPAALDTVLAVGACDRDGKPMHFNNHGKKLRKKTLLAPGFGIEVAQLGGGEVSVTGSSFAAPIVTGIATLTISLLKQLGSDIHPSQIIHWLLKTSHPCNSELESCDQVMAGRLSPSQLVQALKQQFPTLNVSPIEDENHKRSNTMQDNLEESVEAPESVSSVMPSDIGDAGSEEVIHDQVVPAEVEANISGVPKIPQSESLALAPISDSAPHFHVHAKETMVMPQGDCGCYSQGDEKVFVVGTLGYDFGTEARLDYFTQEMSGNASHPFDPEHMARHLNEGENIDQATAMIWVLKIDGIPVYAIEPMNQFAVLQYMRLTKMLLEQEQNGVERISVAGTVSGEVRLFNGQIIPKISPVLRGMFNWKTSVLAKSVMGDDEEKEKTEIHIHNFLNRIYYELRNKGLSSQERAINYSAINAYQMKEVFEDALSESLSLNKISAEISPICRPDSDCWDVVLEFFNPKERMNAAKKLYRYTIDVSDIMPVTVGDMRSWRAY